MWYKDLKGKWPIYFERKLVTEKQFVDLGDLFAAVDVSSLLEKGDIHAAREKTLTFLHQLLNEGKLKAGRIIRLKPGERQPDPETVKDKSVFEDIPGTNDEIIEYIRREWNNNPDFSEFYDCVIRLPENPWPVNW